MANIACSDNMCTNRCYGMCTGTCSGYVTGSMPDKAAPVN